ncbi:MAG: hypothetical protein WCG27_13625, partial [Pseudomonadota bacterium]
MADTKTPLPVPSIDIKVSSSAPRAGVYDSLAPREKKLAYHLIEASRAGRDIIFYQNHRHGLLIKSVLEKALAPEFIADTQALLGPKAFSELLKYSAKFEDLGSPYATSHLKYVLREVTPGQVEELVRIHAPAKISAQTVREVVRLLADPSFEVLRTPEDPAGKGLEECGGNLYERGITGEEVQAALKAGFKSNLNCRIVRGKNGGLKCQVQALNNPEIDPAVRSAFERVVRQLRLAIPYA